jgi:hypothetical protein
MHSTNSTTILLAQTEMEIRNYRWITKTKCTISFIEKQALSIEKVF